MCKHLKNLQRFNAKYVPLPNSEDVFLAPLNIWRRPKSFVRAMDHRGKGCRYLKKRFRSYKSDAGLLLLLLKFKNCFLMTTLQSFSLGNESKLGKQSSFDSDISLETIEQKIALGS